MFLTFDIMFLINKYIKHAQVGISYVVGINKGNNTLCEKICLSVGEDKAKDEEEEEKDEKR